MKLNTNKISEYCACCNNLKTKQTNKQKKTKQKQQQQGVIFPEHPLVSVSKAEVTYDDIDRFMLARMR